MAANRRRAAANSQAARLSAVVFVWLGTIATFVAAIAILLGKPDEAHDLLPIAGFGDLTRRFGEIAPILAALFAALVAAVVVSFVGARRLDAPLGGFELFVLGAVVVVCILGMSGRIGHAADGSVLRATLGCVAGGAAIAAGGIVALLGRE